MPPGRASPAPPRSRRPTRPPPPSPRSPSRRATASWCSPPRAAGAWSPPTRISRIVARPHAAARRPAGRARREAPAPLEPQQPGRPRRRARPATRSPRCIDLIVGHPDVDAVLYLGLGIQSNQAAASCAAGRFYPDHGLERIVDYHERQDARFAQAAAEASERYDKPVLTATELAVTHPDNAGPGRGPGHRAALLPVGQPGRGRPRPPLARAPGTCRPEPASGRRCRRCPCSRWARCCSRSAVLPLHVFEPRYRALVRDCLAARPRARGRADRAGERGGRRRRAHRRRHRRPDRRGRRSCPTGAGRSSRSGPAACGSSGWLPDDPYPLAEVEDWPDPEPGPGARGRGGGASSRACAACWRSPPRRATPPRRRRSS